MSNSGSFLSRRAGLAALLILVVTTSAHAATQNVVFTIDPQHSTLHVSAVGGTYGTYVPTHPGSDTSFVDGHFLVAFDTATDTPTSLQFIGGDGYYRQQTPLALRSAAPGIVATYTNLSWDFSSPKLTGNGGVFPAQTTSFKTWSGTLTEEFPSSPTKIFDESNFQALVTTGTWTLQESAPGSGDWTLSIAGSYVDPGSQTYPQETFALNATSSAHFGATNVTTLAPTDTHADVLGGAGTTGGVSIDLDGTTAGGTFTAQQIPDVSGLSQQAIAAAEKNPVFAASTADLSANPQIWTVDYTGLQAGQSATLVFHYDPTLLPAGLDQSTLGIWHFNKIDNKWEFGGIVDTTNHTIAFETTSFSPFQLGTTAVPEPSTIVLAALGLLALAGYRQRRRSG